MKTVFARKNKSAVSPVIGTILMVAITVVLAAVLYVMVAGLGPGNTPQNATMVMQGGSWSGGTFTFSVTSAPTNVLHGGTFKVLYSSAAITTATFP